MSLQADWSFPSWAWLADEPIKGLLHFCHGAFDFHISFWFFLKVSTSLLYQSYFWMLGLVVSVTSESGPVLALCLQTVHVVFCPALISSEKAGLLKGTEASRPSVWGMCLSILNEKTERLWSRRMAVKCMGHSSSGWLSSQVLHKATPTRSGSIPTGSTHRTQFHPPPKDMKVEGDTLRGIWGRGKGSWAPIWSLYSIQLWHWQRINNRFF